MSTNCCYIWSWVNTKLILNTFAYWAMTRLRMRGGEFAKRGSSGATSAHFSIMHYINQCLYETDLVQFGRFVFMSVFFGILWELFWIWSGDHQKDLTTDRGTREEREVRFPHRPHWKRKEYKMRENSHPNQWCLSVKHTTTTSIGPVCV